MEYHFEDNSKSYIVQALFTLMENFDYDDIDVSQIAKKAGVGRSTFYRYFKKKEDIIIYYLESNTKLFVFNQRYIPRCKEDHIKVVESVFSMFRDNSQAFKAMRKAHLDYLYLNYLNDAFINCFGSNYSHFDKYMPLLYSGMLFNISMAWLDNDFDESPNALATTFIDSVYFNERRL